MDKTRSNETLLFALLDVLFVAVSAVLFLLGSDFGATFWCAYAGFAVAFVAQVVLYLTLTRGEARRTDAFFHAPLYYIGGAYLAVAALVALAQLFLPFTSLRLALAAQVVLFAAFLVLVLSGLIGRNQAQAALERVAEKNALLIQVSAELQTIAGSASAERGVQKKIAALAEEAAYGTPMAHAGLDDVERDLRRHVAALKGCVLAADWAAAESEIAETRQLLLSRNDLCKALRA